jgi:hypothetical protein
MRLCSNKQVSCGTVNCGRSFVEARDERHLDGVPLHTGSSNSTQVASSLLREHRGTVRAKEMLRDLRHHNPEKRNRLKTKTNLHGLSPRANYTDRATATCRRS